MQHWKPDREGYVTYWMTQGPEVVSYESDFRDPNQLRYEAALRSRIAQHTPLGDVGEIRAGETGPLGSRWQVMCGPECTFVNLSDFYATLQRVRFHAATVLETPEALELHAVLWSYTAVDVYVNGIFSGGIEAPVYKPIERCELRLSLQAGRNLVYLSCETLGVRDTRSVVGLQLLDAPGTLSIDLPDAQASREADRARRFLERSWIAKDRLLFPSPAPAGTLLSYRHGDPDLAKCLLPDEKEDVSGKSLVSLRDGESMVTVTVATSYGDEVRRFERTDQIVPQRVTPAPSFEENLQIIYRRIADVQTLSRGEKFGFPISNLLARRYLRDPSPEDGRLMEEMLELIRARVDCSDFLVCGLIRYLHQYSADLSEETAQEIRDVLLNYRYWMDMDGTDGMCFWSENHSLMFYSAAMHAGALYPEGIFSRAHMTGRELEAWGRGKVEEWLLDVEEHGFEEFLSTVYMCVTFAALINVVDYSETAISQRASRVTDRLLRMLALHTFRGGIVAPMGRVYRGVLYPARQGAMALMNLVNPALPYDFGEGWLGFYPTSRYRLPEGLTELMEQPASTRYRTGNAEIVLEKHEDWCLTSVACPREDAAPGRWENMAHRPDADPSTHAFTKSYNECFHGTTCFQPGIYGYQQHLWYAALDAQAILFVNHPGASSEGGDMRPGYWHGNGVMPAMRQTGNMLALIYRIPREHPLHYIHLYAPRCRFDELHDEGSWLFVRKDRGCAGFFSTCPREKWTGLNADCEERMVGDDIACLVVMGGREYENLKAFEEACLQLEVRYEGDTLTYGSEHLTYVQGQDDTQYL